MLVCTHAFLSWTTAPTLCSFRGFGKDSNGNFPQQYWREIAARLSFIIIFEVSRREGEGREGKGEGRRRVEGREGKGEGRRGGERGEGGGKEERGGVGRSVQIVLFHFATQ